MEDAIGNLTFPSITGREIVLASENVTDLDLSSSSTTLLNATSSGFENLSFPDQPLDDDEVDWISVAIRNDRGGIRVNGGGALNLLQLEDAYAFCDDAYIIEQLTTKNAGATMNNVTTTRKLNATDLDLGGFTFPVLESLGSVFLQGISRSVLKLPSIDIQCKFNLERMRPDVIIPEETSPSIADGPFYYNNITGVDKIRTI